MKSLPVLILTICLCSGCDTFKGPTGPDGLQGETGNQGPQGETGEKYEQEGSITLSDLDYYLNYFDDSTGQLIVWGNMENSGTTVLDNIKIHVKVYNELDGLIIAYYFIPDHSVLAPGEKSSFKSEFYCRQIPERVTFGYSGNVPIYVPAQKRTTSPGDF